MYATVAQEPVLIYATVTQELVEQSNTVDTSYYSKSLYFMNRLISLPKSRSCHVDVGLETSQAPCL